MQDTAEEEPFSSGDTIKNMAIHTFTRQRNPSSSITMPWPEGDNDDDDDEAALKASIRRTRDRDFKASKSIHGRPKTYVRGRARHLTHLVRRYEPSLSPDRQVRRKNAHTWPLPGDGRSKEEDQDDPETGDVRWDDPTINGVDELEMSFMGMSPLDASDTSTYVDSPQYYTSLPWIDGETPNSTATSIESTPTLTPATVATEMVQDHELATSCSTPKAQSCAAASTRSAKAPTVRAVPNTRIRDTRTNISALSRQRRYARGDTHAICMRPVTGEWESVNAVFDASYPQSLLSQETADVLGLQPQPLPTTCVQTVMTPAGVVRVQQAAYNVAVKCKMLRIPPMSINILVVPWHTHEPNVIIGQALIGRLTQMSVRLPMRISPPVPMNSHTKMSPSETLGTSVTTEADMSLECGLFYCFCIKSWLTRSEISRANHRRADKLGHVDGHDPDPDLDESVP